MRLALVISALSFTSLISCGGGSAGPAHGPIAGDPGAVAQARQMHECGKADHVHQYDLHDEDGDSALVPCSKSAAGQSDYSGMIHIETIPEGVHITIHASDDEVTLGELGADVKTRDAVIVYPKGAGSKAIEVPLMKTKDGYVGDKIVLWEDLGRLNDEGTKIDVAIFDHDKSSGQDAEELHVAVAVSTGKSCEKALDENVQTVDMGRKGKADLTDAQLGAPLNANNGQLVTSCGLANDAHANICVAVKQGKPVGVSVRVSPSNNKVAACIDRAARHLSFPASDKLDVVKTKF
ncbi:MAG TPA: hypothetical protein VF316_22655 [Polyangiaceae bacterium]